MSSPATVRINDDLATSQTCVTVRAANDESTGRVDVIFCVTVQHFRRNDFADHFLLHEVRDLFLGNSFVMLG